MEDLQQQPEVQEPVQPTSVSQEQEPVQTTPAEQDVTQQQPQGGEDDRHQQNWNNGRRRIQQRQGLKARIRDLETRLAQYEGKTDDYSRFQHDNLQERLADMQAMEAENQAAAFEERASQWLGEDTPKFMQDTYRYAEYVNANEPDLLKMSAREYGPILLHEWYKRMDNQQLRAQWFQMTQFEKGQVLNNLYNQISQVVQQARSGQPQGMPQVKPQNNNVPVPRGGRQTAAAADPDDFSQAFNEAMQRHKGR